MGNVRVIREMLKPEHEVLIAEIFNELYLNGKKLTEPEGKELGLEIMRKLNEYTKKWKADENIDYSLYGTPLESTTYKFAKCLQKRFGIVSLHVNFKPFFYENVRFNCDATRWHL